MNNNGQSSNRIDFLYKIGRAFFVMFLKLFYGLKILGRENIPAGAAIFCGNHSHSFDAFYMAVAVNNNQQLHFMAKKEIFENKLFAFAMNKVGAFPVNRQGSDVSAIKTALRYLKNGDKIGIFPEGTRVSSDNAVQAKHGALKLAERTGAPIVPVYIPREKKLFRRNTVVIGVPYFVNPDRKKLTAEEYNVLADELMKKIGALRTKIQ